MGEKVPAEEGFAQPHGELADHSLRGNEFQQGQQTVDCCGEQEPERVLTGQCAYQYAPVGVGCHQQPDTHCIAGHSCHAEVSGGRKGGKGYEQEQPEQVVEFETHLYEEGVDQSLSADRQQQIGFDLLRRSGEEKTDQKVNQEEEDQDAVECVIGFHAGDILLKSKGQRNPDQNEVRCPECCKQINQELGKAVPVVHGVPLCCKFLVSSYFGQ